MSKDIPNLSSYADSSDNHWTPGDQANLNFLQMKYKNRESLGDEWVRKRKIADNNKTRDDGTANPHHARLEMESTIARLEFDMAYMMEMNRMLFEQFEIMSSLYQRVGLLEGAYGHLQQSTNYVKNQYKDSMQKHFEDRKEWSTQNQMRVVGLNPDSSEDRLKWAKRIDEMTAKFNTEGAKR